MGLDSDWVIKSFNFETTSENKLVQNRENEVRVYDNLRVALKSNNDNKIKGITGPSLIWRLNKPLAGTEFAPQHDDRCVYMSPRGSKLEKPTARIIRDYVQVKVVS